MKILLNGEYGAIHGAYWMYYGVIASFSSVFLLDKGYDNYQIGIIFALGNIISVFFQPILADVSDRAKRFSSFEVTIIGSIFMAVLGGSFFFFSERSLMLSVIYATVFGVFLALQPILNSLAFKLSESGYYVDFGSMRSVGSLGFSILCLVLGDMVEKLGVGILPIVGETLIVLLIVILILTKITFKKALEQGMNRPEILSNRENVSKDEEVCLLTFIKRKPYFMLLNVGVMVFFLQNAVTNNFMLQIVKSVGGNSADMGRILFVMAFLEMPGLLYFSKLSKKFKLENLIKFGCLCFTLKLLTMAVATNVITIYIAHVFHMLSFPLFLSGMITYINSLMKKAEAVKGQALFTTSITISGIFASVFGGVVLDLMGAKAMLYISTGITFLGMVMIAVLIPKVNKESDV